jgi:hypothetical protein
MWVLLRFGEVLAHTTGPRSSDVKLATGGPAHQQHLRCTLLGRVGAFGPNRHDRRDVDELGREGCGPGKHLLYSFFFFFHLQFLFSNFDLDSKIKSGFQIQLAYSIKKTRHE